MARTAPILLALILNCCEIFVFRNIYNVTYSPHSSCFGKDIFTIGNFFLLLGTRLYPKSFRRSHWIARGFFEFLIGLYLLETFLCDFWFPLECFTHSLVKSVSHCLKKKTPRYGVLCMIMCNVTQILQHKKIYMGLSVALSSFMTMIILHGTRTIDFGILRGSGVKEFVLHLKSQLVRGIKKFVYSMANRPSSSCTRQRSCSRPHC